jgi:Uma2 family endonuclease
MAEMTEITKMTTAHYMGLPETSLITELIDGEIFVTPEPSDAHQKRSIQLLTFLIPILKEGVIRHAPTGVHFDDGNHFEPDIFWISPQNDHCVLVDGKYWQGAPDLVIEILSPSTEYRDRDIKFETYQKYGVREYWLVSPLSQFIEVYVLTEGTFIRQGVFGLSTTFHSAVLGGVEVNVDALIA